MRPARDALRNDGWRLLGTAVLLCVASTVLFWPGYAMYDTLTQYRQVLAGHYDDWHPPAMARLWALLPHGDAPTAPMLLIQQAGYWGGLGLIAGALDRRRGALVLVIGALPVFLGWQGVILKDAQMLGALLLAIGLIACWRLRGARLPWPVMAAAGALLAYATLVRVNAVFATVPLMVMLSPRPRRWWTKAVVMLAAIVAIVAIEGPLNHDLLGARASGVERTGAIYDLAGIAVRSEDTERTGFSARAIATMRAKHCVKPHFWDPLGDARGCAAETAAMREGQAGSLYPRLVIAILHHPIAYAAHRIAHLNSTDRWIVPARWPGAQPPSADEPSELRLAAPGASAARFQAVAGWMTETPLGWPVAWIVAALIGMWTLPSVAAGPRRDLARALLVSALALEASFAVLSIASDLRYHLWPMIATALGWALIGVPVAARHRLWIGGTILALVLAMGIAARAMLPAPPKSYAAMIAA